MNIRQNDIINGKTVLHVINDRVRFADNSTKSVKLTERLIAKHGITKFCSPDVSVDWTDEAAIDTFYNSFKQWGCPIRNGSERLGKEIYEVKNNKIFVNGQYFVGTGYAQKKVEYEDGLWYAELYVIGAEFYSHMSKNNVNLFVGITKLTEAQMQAFANKAKLLKELTPVEYVKSIDLSSITSTDLQMLKNNFGKAMMSIYEFRKTINLPKPVTFYEDAFANVESLHTIAIQHRNRTGRLSIDNGCRSNSPFGENYYALIKVTPDFTNECKYAFSININNLNNINFESIAKQVAEKWDAAIENNAVYR